MSKLKTKPKPKARRPNGDTVVEIKRTTFGYEFTIDDGRILTATRLVKVHWTIGFQIEIGDKLFKNGLTPQQWRKLEKEIEKKGG